VANIVLLDAQLKEKTWQIEDGSLQIAKVIPPFNDPVPLGYDREVAAREGYRVKCKIFFSKNPEENHELSFIYLGQQKRIFNLSIPAKHRVEDLTPLLQQIQAQLLAENSSGS